MDFDFDQDQLMLRDSVREYLSKECPPEFVRSMFEHPLGYSKEMWTGLAGLDWLGLTFPEEYGGLGLGMVELCLVLEEMGRAVFPGPYFSSVVLAGTAIMRGGTAAQKAKYLGAIAKGETIGTFGVLEDSVDWGPEAIKMTATEKGGGYALSGMKRFVPFAHAADVIIVPARTSAREEGISLFLVDSRSQGLSTSPMTGIDLTNRASEVKFDNVVLPAENRLGEPDAAWPIIKGVLQTAAVAASAEMLGCSRKAMEMSVEYAKMREQFGQPIGAFQAIKHKCAEMFLEVENSHSAVYYSAWAQDAGSDDADLAASAAKAYVGEAARKVCGEAIQVHGGIGFTWEIDLHLYFKRAKHYELMYGDASHHQELALRQVASNW
jgi:alkylation response protein AidB-like acyl-CoA dehydrogenase